MGLTAAAASVSRWVSTPMTPSTCSASMVMRLSSFNADGCGRRRPGGVTPWQNSDQRKFLAGRIEELLEAHPLSEVLTSMPGIGVRTGATPSQSGCRDRPAGPFDTHRVGAGAAVSHVVERRGVRLPLTRPHLLPEVEAPAAARERSRSARLRCEHRPPAPSPWRKTSMPFTSRGPVARQRQPRQTLSRPRQRGVCPQLSGNPRGGKPSTRSALARRT